MKERRPFRLGIVAVLGVLLAIGIEIATAGNPVPNSSAAFDTKQMSYPRIALDQRREGSHIPAADLLAKYPHQTKLLEDPSTHQMVRMDVFCGFVCDGEGSCFEDGCDPSHCPGCNLFYSNGWHCNDEQC